ncbi:hypothetical protein V1514DRAFT_106092 [Lipomyces japonicus]|uniref:uncharacterized protein n=1 Tax=Lipomyces japonicus TaxID=56871 RepID=UPI0034CD5C35
MPATTVAATAPAYYGAAYDNNSSNYNNHNYTNSYRTYFSANSLTASQISPSSSASSSSSILADSPTQASLSTSPTSTRSFYTPPPPPPHLRSLKKPLYRPAVLRYGTSLKVNGEDWSNQLFWGTSSAVSGLPRRNHWVTDESVQGCSSCQKAFTFWERRHHCRRCGLIFCAGHSSHVLRLDQNCNFHPSGTLARTCDTCANDFASTVVAALSSQGAPNSANKDAINNINRINNMVRNKVDGQINIPADFSDDEFSDTPTMKSSASSTPIATPAGSLKFSASGTSTPEVIDGRAIPFGQTDVEYQLQISRQLQRHVQQQLGAGNQAKEQLKAGTPTNSDQVVGSVPADWSWSTF